MSSLNVLMAVAFYTTKEGWGALMAPQNIGKLIWKEIQEGKA
jgi:hypothetical protein